MLAVDDAANQKTWTRISRKHELEDMGLLYLRFSTEHSVPDEEHGVAGGRHRYGVSDVRPEGLGRLRIFPTAGPL